MKKSTPVLPQPVKRDERICFGIVWFATETEADEYSADVKRRGVTYNGGYMHGVPCGRDTTWDTIDKQTGQKIYAVTH